MKNNETLSVRRKQRKDTVPVRCFNGPRYSSVQKPVDGVTVYSTGNAGNGGKQRNGENYD